MCEFKELLLQKMKNQDELREIISLDFSS